MFKVIDPGFFTTVQDAGRFGLRDKGVPVSGCMDSRAAKMANLLLDNDKSDAVLEITMTGPKLEFEIPTYIAICGADMSPSINGKSVQNNEVCRIEAGDILSFGKLRSGLRTYLAVKGGLHTEEILGSRSYFKSITRVTRLKARDEIEYEASNDYQPKISHIKTKHHYKDKVLEVYPGPEFSLLDDDSKAVIFRSNFKIAKENNRMAYQLEEKIKAPNITMITSANIPGTVQLTPGGRLIVLMKDGQTTGGYPRILQLSENSIAALSQKRFGDRISFQKIEV